MSRVIFALSLLGIALASALYLWLTPEAPKEQCVPLYAETGLECCQ